MSVVSIVNEASAALEFAVFVRGYKLCDTRETLGKRGNVIAKIDEGVRVVAGHREEIAKAGRSYTKRAMAV